MSGDERFDGLFMTAIQQSNGIDNFFNNLFSFMRRKTDFFTLSDKSKSIVLSALDDHLSQFNEQKQREAALRAKQEAEKREKEQRVAEEAARKKQGESTAQVEEVSEEEALRIMEEEKRKKEEREREDNKEGEDEKEGEGEEDKEGEKKEKGMKPNSGNGGDLEKYRWTQTLEEVTVYVPLPDNVASRQLDVQMKAQQLKIGLKGQTPIIDGALHKKIKTADSLWTLETDGPKRILQMTLVKVDGMNWWNCVIEGDPKIDTQKVEPENSKLSDLDSETRSTVEKMMFDQQ